MGPSIKTLVLVVMMQCWLQYSEHDLKCSVIILNPIIIIHFELDEDVIMALNLHFNTRLMISPSIKKPKSSHFKSHSHLHGNPRQLPTKTTLKQWISDWSRSYKSDLKINQRCSCFCIYLLMKVYNIIVRFENHSTLK